jgi:phosphoglycerate dehydrogenase-like enzyme
MRICVLDDVDLEEEQFARLAALGQLDRYEGTPANPEETIARIGDAEIVVLGWTQVDREILKRLPGVKLISVWATGYDYVDTVAAKELAITVTNVPDYAGVAVAELTFGLLIALIRKMIPANASVLAGNNSWRGFSGMELCGRTLGVIGVGHIGAKVARIGAGIGMHVIGTVRHPSPQRAESLGVELVELGDLLARSDVVSVNCPLTPETRGLLGGAELASMKKGAYLISTTRSVVIDQDALHEAVTDGPLAGAALDEVDDPANPLVHLPNVLVTPHIGFNTPEATVRKGDVCVRNVEAFVSGSPANVVN